MDKKALTASLTELPLNEIVTEAQEQTFGKGETPFTSDMTQNYFYFILEGKIKISQINIETGKEQTTALLTQGDMFDIVTLLDQKAHHYIATTLGPTRLMQAPIAQIRELLHTNPEFNKNFFPYLATQMRNLEDLAIDISLYDVYERTLRLIARNLSEDDEGMQLHLINDLSHEELASLLGTVRKVLNKNLQRLKQEGVIDISRKKLTLKDIKKLFEKIEYLE